MSTIGPAVDNSLKIHPLGTLVPSYGQKITFVGRVRFR
jgi:hypothetical protein